MSDMLNQSPRRRGRRPVDASEPVEAVDNAVPRGDMRETMRDDDPRARAARRAAEIRGHRGDMDEGTDEFHIDQVRDSTSGATCGGCTSQSCNSCHNVSP